MVFGSALSQRFGSNRRGADGIRVENFPQFTTLGILAEIQKMMAELSCEPEQIQGWIIFMWMYNDIIWRTTGNEENWMANSLNVAAYANKFPQGCWSFLGPGCEKRWYGNHVGKPDGEWDKTAESMMLNFAESGHPIFRASSALEEEKWEAKRKKMTTVHFNASEETVEWIHRTVISVNQLSFNGAVSDLCKELDPDSRNQTEGEFCESLVISTEIPNANAISQSSTSSAQGDLLQEYERKSAELPDDQKLSKLCSDAGFLEETGKGQFFLTLEEDLEVMQTVCREYTLPRDHKHPEREGGFVEKRKSAQSWR